MRALIAMLACISLSGCVTYIHYFDPKKPSYVCGNAAGCRVLSE